MPTPVNNATSIAIHTGHLGIKTSRVPGTIHPAIWTPRRQVDADRGRSCSRRVPWQQAGIECLVTNHWQAIILDVALPEQDGFEVLRSIRFRCDTPILVHTMRGDDRDVVAALEAGADGFLHKRCCARHLLARLHAIMRRVTSQRCEATAQEIVIAGLRIVPEVREVTLHGRAMALTAGEFDILHSLARATGRVKTRDLLLAEIRHCAYDAADRAIDVQVSDLRRKLGDDPKQPQFIRTVRSAGYMLVSPDAR